MTSSPPGANGWGCWTVPLPDGLRAICKQAGLATPFDWLRRPKVGTVMIRGRTGGPAECAFAVGTWARLLPSAAYRIGTAEYPDRSATLIVELTELSATGATLRRPGIKSMALLSLPDLTPFQANARTYPLGRDFYFTAGTRHAALPRSTQVG